MGVRLATMMLLLPFALTVQAGLPVETTTTSTTETTTTETATTETTTPETTTTETTAPPLETTTTVVVTTTTTVPAPGACDPSRPADCDDGDPCTFDSCAGALLGCVHRPLDGTPCADDGVFCTVDRCVAGVCAHLPASRRCDGGGCVIRTCAPGDPHADRQGCITVRGRNKHDGSACTDDGFSCTDDVCMHGACMHMPFDDRCVPPKQCMAAACDPAQPNHDDAGCARGAPRAEGEACAEDADACTRDVCSGGVCAHEPESDQTQCAPVQEAFSQSLAAGTVAAELHDDLAAIDAPVAAVALGRLAAIEAQLEAATAALDGLPPGVTPALAVHPAADSTMTAEERARIAFTTVLRTPRQISAFLQTLSDARARAQLGRPTAKHFRRRGRVLLRATRVLRANLRALQG